MADAFHQRPCVICGATAVRMIPGYERLARVTSDVKPWPAGGALGRCQNCGAIQKAADAAWLAEISAIYADYDVYHQSGGVEQAVFAANDGRPGRRSDVVAAALARHVSLPRRGRALDIGCGNGAFVAALSRAAPEWRLYGQDLDTRNSAALYAIPGFEALFTQGVETLTATFDLVSMIHSLEHFADPVDALSCAAGRLAPDGFLFIQVPDAEANPFDLTVADHLSHFSAATLRRLVELAGLSVVILANDWVAKELSLTAVRKGNADENEAAGGKGGTETADNDWATEHIAMLTSLAVLADQIVAKQGAVGIFGTAIGATWLRGRLGDRVSFFIDEDPARQGRQYMGAPVFAPHDAPAGATVLAPLAPKVAAAVAARFANAAFTLIAPPG